MPDAAHDSLLDRPWAAWAVSALVFCLMAVMGLAYLDAAQNEREAEARLALVQSVAGRVQALQNLLFKAQAPLATLADVLVVNRGEFKDFDAYARHLLESNPGVAGLFLCPDGVVRVAVPLAGNEAALGHELLKDPQRKAEVEEAIATNSTVLAGPVAMRQGGMGLFARKPVFWEEGGRRVFWGLVVSLIRWETVLDSAEFRAILDGGYALRLERKLATDPEPVVIARSETEVLPEFGVTRPLTVPGGQWLLTLSPLGAPDMRFIRVGELFVLAASGVGGWLVLLVLQGRSHIVAQSRELERANAELEARLLERGLLIKEVHHRVKNNLQIIISLLDLQNSGVDNPEFTALAAACKDRILAIALAHEQVYRRDNLASIGVSDYLHGLVGNVLQGYRVAERPVTWAVDTDGSEIPLAKAVYVGLIVTELVTNAVKHAFDGAEEPRIEVRFDSAVRGIALVSVRDNGRGFPGDGCPESASSLGLTLVRSLAGQLGGEMRCASLDGALVEVSLRLS
ncbi:putative sensor histidine kinase pdtaS [Fundidesulfovibrio magnetotacticus]|uniref:histidine kinase n=1 Tax=Fundidesulfovibrio magnetotacticus TaxID=2730080 RepID=A0A6V8LY38_9BACT|nr:histidine kinase dimerization/phosphoacceptor domain -containing protein [Fundidesulfovibrio magnetotacticus]GFK95511.1 putative sensor histidine kinase pdtaS [Fundidesulfovibrio magnetotacticus]